MDRRLVIPNDGLAAVPIEGDLERPRTLSDQPSTAGAPDPNVTPAPEGGTDAFSAAVIHSKVRSPALRSATLERPRLLAWVEQHASRRVRLLIAEAGYGKSTLLADHARRYARRTVWFRLDSSDRDWTTFISYLVASVREIRPGFAPATVALLQQVGVLDPSRDVVFNTLLAELETVATEPLTLILDDFHLVQDAPDVRAMVMRLLDHAPAGLSVVIAGRDRPSLPLARLASQGAVAEITTEELRFTRLETAGLFADSGTPLAEDLIGIIDERIEGWVASLQLVSASLIALHPDEIRSFVRGLSAHSEPLYEFLAEEVLSRQTPVMRRVLTHASIVARISPHLVAAATADPRPVTVRQIAVCLGRAEEVGMVSRASTRSVNWRVHPLVREFLHARLIASISNDDLIAMHLRIAVAAEPSDWLTAAHHYLEAGRPDDAMRVLRQSALQALGTASWGDAMGMLDRIPDSASTTLAAVFRARTYLATGQAHRAVTQLEGMIGVDDDVNEWALLKIALASAYLATDNFDRVRDVADAMLARPDTPPIAASVARAYRAILEANSGGPIADACDTLAELGAEHARQALPYFAAVCFHNAALGHYCRGRYSQPPDFAVKAVDQFALATGRSGVESTFAILAMANWELGHADLARQFMREATKDDGGPADAFADVAWILGAVGDTDNAWLMLSRATKAAIDGDGIPGAYSVTNYTRLLICAVTGKIDEAVELITDDPCPSIELDATVRHLTLQALVELLADHESVALRLCANGLAIARVQGATHWSRWLELIQATASKDRQGFRRAVIAIFRTASLSSLALVDVVVRGLDLLESVPSELGLSVSSYVERWLPALRRTVESACEPCEHAAELLAKHGSLGDVAILKDYEKRHIKQLARRTLSRQLARRTNPTLVLHDLGRVAIDVGQRRVLLSQTRRRTASLFAYLASRPGHSATREQVLEALWPSQSPSGAANSLHQTLYFLRRDIDPWFEEARTVHYLVSEQDVVFLDQDLVQVDSSAFLRQAQTALLGTAIARTGAPLLRDYAGPFAPEFAYEDWSMAWRDQVHSTYLLLAQRTGEALVEAGDISQAIDVLERALTTDPDALDLEASLIVALLRADALAAASRQYSHFARAQLEQLGVEPPSLDEFREQAKRMVTWRPSR